MMADLGFLALVIALLVAVLSFVIQVLSIKTGDKRFMESARGGMGAIAILVSVSSAALLYLLVTSDFSVLYVYRYTSLSLSLLYKLSAFWAGNAGSLLLWALVLSIYSAIVANSKQEQNKKLMPYVNLVLLINNIFFLLAVTFFANPFAPTGGAVMDGRGLNPMLQNPGMIIHPITVFLGYVGFVVPFAFAMAALITKDSGDLWIKSTRRWTVLAWLFLSIGNLYGAQWAYTELGWGGFWAWDPVENASFLPWLTATAFIHSVMIQERKGMFKIWNMALIIVTYILTLFGTYIVRSGVITSVHAFGVSQQGNLFLGFLTLMLFASVGLLIWRSDTFKEEKEFESYLSRESSFLLNNLFLVGAAFAVFWGTIFPLVSNWVKGVAVTVGPPFFNQVAGPILFTTLFLMGICPVIAWQKSNFKKLVKSILWPFISSLPVVAAVYFVKGDGQIWQPLVFGIAAFTALVHLKEIIKGTLVRSKIRGDSLFQAFWGLVSKNRRRYGGYLVHLGTVLIALAIVGTMGYPTETTKTVQIGETIEIGGYTLTYQGLQEKMFENKGIVYAEMPVVKDGKLLGSVAPEKVFYPEFEQPTTEVSIMGGFKEDLYVVLSSWSQGGEIATIKININPLMAWMWIGGYLLIIGTLFAVWPGRGSRLGPRYKSRPA
ncbi:MAG: heme lyase CcmF/NrfE family subunit [Bacillota bacterium]